MLREMKIRYCNVCGVAGHVNIFALHFLVITFWNAVKRKMTLKNGGLGKVSRLNGQIISLVAVSINGTR